MCVMYPDNCYLETITLLCKHWREIDVEGGLTQTCALRRGRVSCSGQKDLCQTNKFETK